MKDFGQALKIVAPQFAKARGYSVMADDGLMFQRNFYEDSGYILLRPLPTQLKVTFHSETLRKASIAYSASSMVELITNTIKDAVDKERGRVFRETVFGMHAIDWAGGETKQETCETAERLGLALVELGERLVKESAQMRKEIAG